MISTTQTGVQPGTAATSEPVKPFQALVKRIAARSAVYTLGVLALRFGGLLLIPIYWRLLDPTQYGILAVTAMIGNFLTIFLGLAISESITRFYHAWSKEERADRLGSIWILDWSSSLIIGIPVVLFSQPLIERVVQQVAFDPYIKLGIWAAIFASFSMTPMYTIRIEDKAKQYVLCAAMAFVLKTGLALWLVAVEKHGVLGVLEADLYSSLAMIPIYTIIMLRRARLVFRWKYLSEALRFSLPLVPSAFLDGVQSVADRFLLEKYIPLAQLGFYALGDNFGGLLRGIYGALKTAWVPFAMESAIKRENGAALIARMATLFFAANVFCAVSLAALSPDLIQVIGVEKYKPVAGLIPLFALPYLVLGSGALFGIGLTLGNRNEYTIIISIVHMVVYGSGLIVLVPRYGVHGALVATTAGVITRLVCIHWIAQRLYPIPYSGIKVMLLFCGGVATYAICRALPLEPGAIGLVARGLVLAVFIGSACIALGARKML